MNKNGAWGREGLCGGGWGALALLFLAGDVLAADLPATDTPAGSGGAPAGSASAPAGSASAPADAFANLTDKWHARGFLTGRATYTDNVNLSSGRKTSDLVMQLNPGFSLRRNGGRIKANIAYNMQNLFYARDSQRDTSHHQLAASGTAEVVDDMLFVEARAGITQEVPSLLAPIGVDNINGNVTDATTWSINPYGRWRLGNYATAAASYAYDVVRYDQAVLSNSHGNRYSLTLGSGPKFRDISWGLSYKQENVHYESRPDTESSLTTANVGYAVNSRLKFFANSGYEKHTFPGALQPSRGSFWDVGARWNPTVRTTLEYSHGHRFFGDTNRFTLSHRTRYAVWDASYSEDVTSIRNQQLLRTPILDEQGRLILFFDPATNQFVVPLREVLLTTDEQFITKSLHGGVSITRGKSTWAASVFNSRRDFLTSGTSDRQFGALGVWNLRLGARTNGQATAAWQRNQIPVANREDDVWTVGVGLSHRLRKNLSGNLDARHQERTSNVPGAEFKENAISASLTWTF